MEFDLTSVSPLYFFRFELSSTSYPSSPILTRAERPKSAILTSMREPTPFEATDLKGKSEVGRESGWSGVEDGRGRGHYTLCENQLNCNLIVSHHSSLQFK